MKIPVKVFGTSDQDCRQDERSEKMSYPYKNFDDAEKIFETKDCETTAFEDRAMPNPYQSCQPEEPQDDIRHSSQEINDDKETVASGPAKDLDWRDMYMRLKADFENHKRNANAERDRLSGIGKESVIDDVLPLVDHMEMAIKAAKEGESGEGILKGIEIVYKQLICALEKHGVQRVPSTGLPFDPKIHEAVGVVPVPDAPENMVVHEVRPGFIRAGKLIRPTSVIVSK